MNTSEKLKLVLLGVMVTLMAVLAFRPGSGLAYAANGAAPQGVSFFAIADNNGLYLINATDKQIAYYAKENNGFQLRGARYYGFDMGIYDYHKTAPLDVKEAADIATSKKNKDQYRKQ